MTLIMDGSCQAGGEAALPVNATQEERTKIREPGSALEICTDRSPGDRRKTELLWAKVGPEQTSCMRYGRGFVCLLRSQRLPRGLPCLMHYVG